MAYRKIYEIEVRHEDLKKFRLIRGSDRYVVEQKAIAQGLAWDEMWGKRLAVEQKKKDREAAIRSKEEKKELATTKTKEAQESINQVETILLHTLDIDDAIDWDSLLDNNEFPKKKPVILKSEPYRSDEKYQPTLGFFDRVFPSFRRKKEQEAEGMFALDYEAWEKARDEHTEAVTRWETERLTYESKRDTNNKRILEKKNQYQKKEPDAITDYCEMVLAKSKYPDFFPQEWDLDFQAEAKIMIVDYSLPDLDSLPTVKGVKYIASRDEFTESNLSNAAVNKIYDSLLYQIALRTIHELYEADVVDAVDSIVFNGWVDAVDKATGHNVNSCILSLQASKEEFLAINLEKIDPKACFKQLKGVGSSKLHGLSPVAPIASINKEDRRFVSAYDVVDSIDNTNNLAAMDWQDFENLIREIFEKEFVSSGGEVKITQASRDGGVDAVAFDPDPIRGGKIVIQAKRYTNVVGVSAVRDLFGTTVNEGATKGILVTTAEYGPDAYEFAKGKPLTLLNGSNLLHLLEKHGHKAKIDLKEAKKILAEKDT